jgi:ADP-ribose diphosphatase
MKQPPRILASRVVARSQLFEIEALDLAFANGKEVTYERINGNKHGAVLIVPVLGDNTVLLIREYAVGSERYELALPKGRIEAGEPLFDAANREMQEEVGYAGRQFLSLISLTMAPGYFRHETHVVLARGLYPSQAEGDEPEPIEVVPWPLAKLDALLAREDVTEARTIAALFMAKEYLNI